MPQKGIKTEPRITPIARMRSAQMVQSQTPMARRRYSYTTVLGLRRLFYRRNWKCPMKTLVVTL